MEDRSRSQSGCGEPVDPGGTGTARAATLQRGPISGVHHISPPAGLSKNSPMSLISALASDACSIDDLPNQIIAGTMRECVVLGSFWSRSTSCKALPCSSDIILL